MVESKRISLNNYFNSSLQYHVINLTIWFNSKGQSMVSIIISSSPRRVLPILSKNESDKTNNQVKFIIYFKSFLQA